MENYPTFQIGLLMPLDQMINLKYGKSFSIELMPLACVGIHLMCCHMANIGIQLYVAMWQTLCIQ
jgi:hypothetical protein